MNQSTSPLPSASQPAHRRSGWLLRAVFAFVLALLLVEAAAVAWLVGGTFFSTMADDGGAQPPPLVTERQVAPGVAGAPTAASDAEAEESNVWDQHGPINILLLGLDEDDCAYPSGSPRRTDTMILVRVDPQSKKASMLSVPRDLYVYIPGFGAKKINTAHPLGAGQDMEDPDAGPRLLMQVFQDNLDLSVHRYVRIDMESFENLIDEGLGGLTMDLPASDNDPTVSLHDTDYPDDKCGTMTVHFEPGEQKLSGAEVVQYARSRKSTSDFDRSRRQMEVLMAVRRAGTRPSILPRVPKLIPAVRDTVDTDLTVQEILSLARIARGIDGDDIISMRIDENITYDDLLVIDNVPQWVLVHRQDALDALRERFLNFQAEESATAANGTGVTTPQP